MTCNHRGAAGLLMLLVLLVGGGASPGENAPLEKDGELLELDARVGQFLNAVSMGETQTAYQELLAGSRLIKQEKALQELSEKTAQLPVKYGLYCGVEQISAKRVGKDLVLLRYLYKCRDFPVVWHFTFYRTPTPGETPPEKAAWRVVTLRFDTELERLAW